MRQSLQCDVSGRVGNHRLGRIRTEWHGRLMKPASILIKFGRHGLVFCFALQLYSWWRRLKCLTAEKEVSNNGDIEEVEISDEEVLKVERRKLFYTWAPGHYKKNPRSKRANHTSAVEQAIWFWRKGPSFFEAIENVAYVAPVQVNTTTLDWRIIWRTLRAFHKKTSYTRWRERNPGSSLCCIWSGKTLRRWRM